VKSTQVLADHPEGEHLRTGEQRDHRSDRREAGLDPGRISFTCAKNAIAARVSDAAAFSPR